MCVKDKYNPSREPLPREWCVSVRPPLKNHRGERRARFQLFVTVLILKEDMKEKGPSEQWNDSHLTPLCCPTRAHGSDLTWFDTDGELIFIVIITTPKWRAVNVGNVLSQKLSDFHVWISAMGRCLFCLQSWASPPLPFCYPQCHVPGVCPGTGRPISNGDDFRLTRSACVRQTVEAEWMIPLMWLRSAMQQSAYMECFPDNVTHKTLRSLSVNWKLWSWSLFSPQKRFAV